MKNSFMLFQKTKGFFFCLNVKNILHQWILGGNFYKIESHKKFICCCKSLNIFLLQCKKHVSWSHLILAFLKTFLSIFFSFLSLFLAEKWSLISKTPLFLLSAMSNPTQHAQWTLNKIENTFNRTFKRWKSRHQGFRI